MTNAHDSAAPAVRASARCRFDRFYRYHELTAILKAFAADYPHLVSLESIGTSHEGRDIWLVTVTNAATGPAADKPAFWVEGNVHATELAASARTPSMPSASRSR